MNYDLAAFEGWGEQQIGRRSEVIARIAIEEWPHPGGSEVVASAN